LVKSRVPGRFASITRAARYVAIVCALLAVGVAAFIGYCEYGNSTDAPFPTDAELRSSLSRASGWLFANSARLLDDNNPMLWLFVRETGRLTDDQHLLTLASEYQSKYTAGTLAQFFFDPSGSDRIRDQYLDFPDNLPDYNRLFVYGATCNVSARGDPAVLALLDPSACDRRLAWLRSPWCRTHQLMGLRFAQKNHCEPDEAAAELVKSVQNLILTELKWDFRVEDAYIQKVLMLVESGRRKDVKAIWLRKVLAAQSSDGGWDDADVIAHLPGDRVLCWSGGRLYPWLLPRPVSNFHATAQGLYLLALLLKSDGEVGSGAHYTLAISERGSGAAVAEPQPAPMTP